MFIGPWGEGLYASYWFPRSTPDEEARVEALALSNPIARRPYSGHTMLERDAKESDLQSVAVGMSLKDVLRLLGDPLSMSAAPDRGFELEFIIWGRWPLPTGKTTLASRTVKLVFSAERFLVSRPSERRPTSGSSGRGPLRERGGQMSDLAFAECRDSPKAGHAAHP
jgi:hypothetical protein